jgi:hypothetical protein
MLLLLMALAAEPATTPPPKIGYLEASELAERCTDPSAHGLEYCLAYLAAVNDTVRAYELWLKFKDMCIPEGTVQNELRTVFLDHLKAHPDQRDGQAASVAVLALQTRYPCPKGNQTPVKP